MVRKFTKASLAMMVLAGSVGAAQAAGPVGSPVTATANIVFVAPASIVHTLTAEQGLAAGNIADGVKFATGNVSLSDASTAIMAVQFTKNVGAAGTNDSTRVISGNTDNTRKLKVKLNSPVSVTPQADGWIVLDGAGANLPYTIVSDGQQVVVADTYTVSVDAAIYQP
ncbi:AfaD family invasin [Serratia marcescens]|uniref:AfaD family invasin n=1 Tax=Serratia marcescens TaxID=615 RepID=UPI00396D05D8